MPCSDYTPVPDERQAQSPDEEMEQAFESDDEDSDSAPLTRSSTNSPSSYLPQVSRQNSGSYDFEREYDHPPPGSPPPPARAVGNSNGVIPDVSHIQRNFPSPSSRQSFFRRAVGAFLPQHYSRVPSSETPEVRGSGVENDGVFSNVLARPGRPTTTLSVNGQEIQEMPEEAQKDAPPSYNEAQRDAVPPYWETTVHAPMGSSDSLLIDGLPSGTVFSFAWNFLISISFQFVGFMLTYLLHTTHAGKFGSRAGLGVTLIQYGLYSRSSYDGDLFGGGSEDETGDVGTTGGSATRLLRRMWMSSNNDNDGKVLNISGSIVHDWISFLLMTIGWFLLLSSILGFARVKRWERSITSPSPASQAYTAERMVHEDDLQARFHNIFIFDRSRVSEDSTGTPAQEAHRPSGPTGTEDEEIRRGLRAVGLI